MSSSLGQNLSVVVLLVSFLSGGLSLDNGLALTPPMGWLSWERFRCNIDCVNDPDNCISENLYMTMADLMVFEGYLDFGYDTVILDDCWMADERSPNGTLIPNAERFPSGMKALGDHIHNLGLKFGIYEDYGTSTCGGYPGVTEDTFTLDANTFAEWGGDYVKLDGCYTDPLEMDDGYPAFGAAMNATGRPMVYSCSWPAYQIYEGIQPNWTSIIETCNLWRNWDDIQDSWDSVTNIIDYYGDMQDEIAPNAGPGHWNDPDMLLIGNFGLSYEESKAQMAIWAIFAAPLIMSNDLRAMAPEMKAILQNADVIAVNQDVLGIQGNRISQVDSIDTWTKMVTPVVNGEYSYAVAFQSRRVDGTPWHMTVSLESIGLSSVGGYLCMELFDKTDYGDMYPTDSFNLYVNPNGVILIKCIAL